MHGEARFYARLGAAVAAVVIILVVARLLFLPLGHGAHGGRGKLISWEEASEHLGQVCTVEGKVIVTHNSGKACFLNFDPDWQRTFSAVIFQHSFGRFPANPEQYYQGKTVRITGRIKEYQGRPEIILESPEQITIVK